MVVYLLARGTRQNGLSSLVRPGLSRWRGEHLFSQIYGLLLFGLSPLAREHGRTEYKAVYLLGLSAGAGNTGSATAAPMTTSVYPLARGTRNTGER